MNATKPRLCLPFMGADHRKWVRHSSGPKTVCRLVLNDALAFWALAVCEVSVGGIRLALDIMPPVGSTFQLELHNPNRRFSCLRQARATHSTAGPGGIYMVGWIFDSDLSYEEIEGLL